MPKIIENVREQLLCEAKRQIEQNGYAKTTVRSVALSCGIGVGTVYNYFKSKDMLIASFMAEDWLSCLEKMKTAATEPKAVLKGVYDGLCAFIEKNRALFRDKAAAKSFMSAFEMRHRQLRRQLAQIVRPICEASPAENKDFVAEFVAQALLSFSMEGKGFDELYSVVGLLLK